MPFTASREICSLQIVGRHQTRNGGREDPKVLSHRCVLLCPPCTQEAGRAPPNKAVPQVTFRVS